MLLQVMLKAYQEGRIDMDEARKNNNRKWNLCNYHDLWKPGPEVLHDAELCKRIISATHPSTPNGLSEFAMVPIGGKLPDENTGLMPKIKTILAKNGVRQVHVSPRLFELR